MRFGLIAAGTAVAVATMLAACTPTTEKPADPAAPATVAPTAKGVVGAQTGTPAPPRPSRAPASTIGPDGTINRGGGRPDTNDNGSWQMSVAPPTMPKPTCTGDICVTGD